jgi:hypothetical protein
VTPAYLSSVASFYDMLNEKPVGRRHVYVCTSVACHMSRAKRVYDAIAEAGKDLEDVEIREFECLGACDMAPMASIDGRYVGPLTTGDAPEVMRQIKNGETVLPGRGLEDAGYAIPQPLPPTEGEPVHPKAEAAGGEWPDAEEQIPPPAEGPPPHRPDITEPLAPGTSYAGEEIDPFTHDVLERDEEEGEE